MIYVEEEGRWAINSVPSDDTLSKFCGEILPASFAWIGRASTLKRVYCPRKLPYLLSSPQFRLSLQKIRSLLSTLFGLFILASSSTQTLFTIQPPCYVSSCANRLQRVRPPAPRERPHQWRRACRIAANKHQPTHPRNISNHRKLTDHPLVSLRSSLVPPP